MTLRAAEALARCGGPKGLTALVALAGGDFPKLARDEALRIAREDRLQEPARDQEQAGALARAVFGLRVPDLE